MWPSQILSQMERSLSLVGSSKRHMLMATIYIPDIAAHKPAFDAQWDAWVPAGTAPVRACVQAHLASPALLVELQVLPLWLGL